MAKPSIFILSIISFCLLLWLLVDTQFLSSQQASTVSSLSGHFRHAVKQASPAVVNVYTKKQKPRKAGQKQPSLRQFFDQKNQKPQVTNLGSGVIVSTAGYIVTNHHLVDSVDAIEVALADGRNAYAQIIGTDPESDLAVIKTTLKNLPVIDFDSAGNAQVGDIVLAIGNPFGFRQSVTMGIISALGRSGFGVHTYENFIQTDAAINPGNSGGALVNHLGKLVGINSSIYSGTGSNTGIAFAIPVATVQQVMAQLIDKGSVTRGWIGVEVQEFDNPSNIPGIVISGLLKNGPAAIAEMRVGDRLLEINGELLTSPHMMLNKIASLTPGQIIECTLLRGQEILTVNITVGKRPPLKEK